MPYTLRQRLAAFRNPGAVPYVGPAIQTAVEDAFATAIYGLYNQQNIAAREKKIKRLEATLRQAVRYYGQAVARWDDARASWEAVDVKQHRKHIKRLRKVAGL